MINFKENILMYLVFLLIVFSLVTPTAIYFFSKSGPTGGASSGTVSVIISDGVCGDSVCDGNETCSTCENDCGVCSGTTGGSSGGGSSNKDVKPVPTVFDVNLDIKDRYSGMEATLDTIYKVTYNGKVYSFEVTSYEEGVNLELRLGGVNYEFFINEEGNFDVDEDNLVDFSIGFDGSTVIIKKINVEEPLFPDEESGENKIRFSKQKLAKESLFDMLGLEPSVLIALAIGGGTILISSVYQFFRLRKLEKVSKGKSIRSTSNRISRMERKRINSRNKLKKQKKILEEARESGYISKKAFEKSINRIKKKL